MQNKRRVQTGCWSAGRTEISPRVIFQILRSAKPNATIAVGANCQGARNAAKGTALVSAAAAGGTVHKPRRRAVLGGSGKLVFCFKFPRGVRPYPRVLRWVRGDSAMSYCSSVEQSKKEKTIVGASQPHFVFAPRRAVPSINRRAAAGKRAGNKRGSSTVHRVPFLRRVSLGYFCRTQ